MPETMSPREKVAVFEPCPGCGADEPRNRCLGCGHDFAPRNRQAIFDGSPVTALASSGDHAELALIEQTVIENLRSRGMRSADTPAIQDVFDALDEWKGIADQEFVARTGAREEATKYKRLLGDLLCIIHRDGGHRIEEIGVDAAHNEAVKLSAALIAEVAALREQVKFEKQAAYDENDRWQEAERKLAEAEDENARWAIRFAELRKAAGIGVKPMLSDVPGELRKMRSLIDRAAELMQQCTDPERFEGSSTLNVYANMRAWLSDLSKEAERGCS